MAFPVANDNRHDAGVLGIDGIPGISGAVLTFVTAMEIRSMLQPNFDAANCCT